MSDRRRLDEKRRRQAEEAKIVWAEVRRQEIGGRERIERLRTLRLAKEAERKSDNQPLTRIGLD